MEYAVNVFSISLIVVRLCACNASWRVHHLSTLCLLSVQRVHSDRSACVRQLFSVCSATVQRVFSDCSICNYGCHYRRHHRITAMRRFIHCWQLLTSLPIWLRQQPMNKSRWLGFTLYTCSTSLFIGLLVNVYV